jgi:4-nitrophenyl phosphatase
MKYKGYFFDLDGVAYQGSQVIPTCRDFVNRLIDEDIKVCFLTNNSSRTPDTVAHHLQDLGYHVNEENIITSSQVTSNYIAKQSKRKIYLIGMSGIYQELTKIGCEIVSENADLVVVGLDFHLTYDKLAKAAQEIIKGAELISTNSDLMLITNNGIAPGNGSITQLIETISKTKAIYMGKPEAKIFEFGLDKLNLTKDEVVMVGDNYYTDILGASQFNIDSIFVETGVMTREEILQFPNQPTYLVKDLSYFNR